MIGCGDVSVVHLEAIENLAGVELVGGLRHRRRPRRRGRRAVRRAGVHRPPRNCSTPSPRTWCTSARRTTSTRTIAIDCLDAGVGVLLEKPVAHTVAEADRLIAAAAAAPGAKIGICLQNRYNATARAARALLESGELGAVLGGSATVHVAPDRRRTTRPGPGAGRCATAAAAS